MRVGLFGNLANNAYILGRILRGQGIDAELVLNPHEDFALSQPIWEDCDFALESELVMSGKTTRDFWIEKSRELGWREPHWVKDIGTGALSPSEAAVAAVRNPRTALRALISSGASVRGLKLTLGNLHAVRALSEFDLVLVYGSGPIYASMANVPFVAIPYGGDVTILPFKGDFTGRRQKRAFFRARKVLVGDPYFLPYLDRLGLSDRWLYFPFPVDVNKYVPAAGSKQKEIADLLPMDIGSKFIFFMPSRQDFYWKGTDRVLRAFLAFSEEEKNALLLTPSWGADSQRAIRIVKENGGERSVIFLPHVLSKVRLIRFFQSADVVIDQFTLGSYGTSTIEAMACGKAVVANIDEARYRSHLGTSPPHLQAEKDEDILSRMKWAMKNPRALADLGAQARTWTCRQHSERSISVLTTLLREFE